MGPEGFMQPPSHTPARVVVVTLLVAVAAGVPALAQTAPWPAGSEPIATNPPIVTVATFQAGRSTHLSAETTAALADELAGQLVDSRRCRVLDQAWLPVRGGATDGSMRTLRDAAASAGVDYLVVGNIVPSSRTIVTQPQAAVYQPPPTVGRISIARSRSRIPVAGVTAMRAAKIRRSFLRITLRVIDVRTGEAVNSVIVESPVRGSAGPLVALLPIPGPGWVAGAIAATAMARSSSTLDAGLREAMASAARTISASWFLRAGARESSALDGKGGRL